MDGTDVAITGVEKLQGDIKLLGIIVFSLWIILFIDHWVFRQRLRRAWGIKPRQTFNPATIILSQLVHNSRQHLFSNSIPLAILGLLTLLPDSRLFLPVTGTITLVDGIGVWYFGKRGEVHFGASGLVMGDFGYVLARGFFQHDTGAVLLAFVVAGFYVGMFKLLVLRKEGISFVSHVSGFVGGLIAAYVISLF
ncbi:MAG: rhomboid family intramembrane serine protease [Anaerolineales bacterium]|nr:rhomboid family intramembrane serine protease [Anaerolineales bacterium]